MRVPARDGEEALVLDLLERDDVVVHPGFFFDFPREAYLVSACCRSLDLRDRRAADSGARRMAA